MRAFVYVREPKTATGEKMKAIQGGTRAHQQPKQSATHQHKAGTKVRAAIFLFEEGDRHGTRDFSRERGNKEGKPVRCYTKAKTQSPIIPARPAPEQRDQQRRWCNGFIIYIVCIYTKVAPGYYKREEICVNKSGSAKRGPDVTTVVDEKRESNREGEKGRGERRGSRKRYVTQLSESIH